MHPDGTFHAEDWRISYTFELDDETGEVDWGDLVPLDAQSWLPGSRMPPSYLMMGPVWYQGFERLDFTRLRDGL